MVFFCCSFIEFSTKVFPHFIEGVSAEKVLSRCLCTWTLAQCSIARGVQPINTRYYKLWRSLCIPGPKSRPVHKCILFGHFSSKSLWHLLQLQRATSVVEVIGCDGHINALRASLLHIIKFLNLKRVQKFKWASKVLIKELLLHERHWQFPVLRSLKKAVKAPCHKEVIFHFNAMVSSP